MEVGRLRRVALVVVDVQRDFCPRGALAVKGGDKVIPPLNLVIDAFKRRSLPIAFTRDWHPSNHCSFKEQGGIWPPHCVAATEGATFHPDLNVPPGSMIISKASEPDTDAYSGFQGTDLDERLRRLGVEEIVVGGLATDYCVKQTSLDGLAKEFEVRVMTDCVRGVNVHRGDSASALRLMKKKGATLTTSGRVVRLLFQRAALVSSSRP